MRNNKKPLGRSIVIGCLQFTTILCLTLSVLNYYSRRKALVNRYQSEITNILTYADAHIDDEDLKACIESGKESETYKEMLRFMDGIMDSFDIHYLYAIKPLNHNETGNVLSVFSAEDYYNRNVDTEGNLYLGWISDDEYDAATVNQLYDIMSQDDIVFFVEETEWSTDYTGALPLKDAGGESYAILCVDVDITTLNHELWSQTLRNAATIVVLGFLYTIAFLHWSKKNITEPITRLEKGVVDYAVKSHGQHSVEALKFDAPDINTENEVESLSKAITKMTEDMQDYVTEMLTAEQNARVMEELASEMSELAVVDGLTGVRNKTAYKREVEKLEEEIQTNEDLRFGMAMVDLNYLKVINDTYGHEKGDEALCSLCQIICSVFAHSPVFRIGGDEFAVLLRGHDLDSIDRLYKEFKAQVSDRLENEPWKHVSAAIGFAIYNKDDSESVDDVLRRADKAMYAQKVAMKAVRKN